MVKRLTERLFDDWTGEPCDRTTYFAFDGEVRAIELTEANRDELRDCLARAIEYSRVVGPLVIPNGKAPDWPATEPTEPPSEEHEEVPPGLTTRTGGDSWFRAHKTDSPEVAKLKAEIRGAIRAHARDPKIGIRVPISGGITTAMTASYAEEYERDHGVPFGPDAFGLRITNRHAVNGSVRLAAGNGQ